MAKKSFEVSGNELVTKVKEIANDANARKVIVKDQNGKQLIAIPMGWGAAGGALALVAAPWLAVLAAIGGAMAKVKLEVERDTPDLPGDDATAPAAGQYTEPGFPGSTPGPTTTNDAGMTVLPTEPARSWDAPPTDPA